MYPMLGRRDFSTPAVSRVHRLRPSEIAFSPLTKNTEERTLQ